MKKIIKIISFVLSFIFICLTFCSCGSNPAARKKGDGDIVLTVGGYEVPRDLYNYFSKGYRDQYLGDGKTDSDEDEKLLSEKIEEETRTSLSQIFAVYSIAADYGITPDDEDIKSAAEAAKEEFIVSEYGGNEDAFYSDLAESSMTVDVFDILMTHDALQNALYLRLTEEGVIITDADAALEKFNSGELARVKHILIKYDSSLYTYKDVLSDDAPAKKAAMDRAKEIFEEVKAGWDFDSLVAKYGEDIMMFRNSDGYYISRGNMENTFEDAAFSLEVGQYAEPVFTSEGVSIIKRLLVDEVYVADNLDDLVTAYAEGQFNILIEERVAELEIVEK